MPSSLPPGIATVTCSFGTYLDPAGNIDRSGSITISLDTELIWAATGDVIEQIDLPVTMGADGRATIVLPVIQSGFVNAAGSAINLWIYTAKWNGFKFTKRPQPFTLTVNDAAPVDIDKKPIAGVTPPQTTPPTPYVNTITQNGVIYTGNVNLPASSGGSGSGATTVQGITDATPLGKSLLLSADQNAAKTQLGLDQVDNTSDTNKPISAATQNAINGLVTNAAFQAALQGVVTTTVLNQQLAQKLDKTTPVLLYRTKVNGTWQPRPVTAVSVPVVWLSYDGTNPPGGGTVGGGAGMVDGTDIVLMGGP